MRNRHRQPAPPPTRPAKAVVAAVTTLLGLVGIHVTSGTAEALVMAGQLALVVFAVWRTPNRPKSPARRAVRWESYQ